MIYGDTDSLFVHDRGAPTEEAAAARGHALAAELTRLLAEELARDYRVESHLELRFESHYLRFLMPTTRGSDRGSKKRYAGTVKKGGKSHLVVRGLEAVRRDWTPVARNAQRELLRRVFADEPFEEWIAELVRDLLAGRLDEQLVYRKRRRETEASAATDTEHVVTTRGPEPKGRCTAPIDYDHYLGKQLAPVCDVVLLPLGLFIVYTARILPGSRVFKHALRGMSYRQMGQTRLALISLGRALQLDPHNPLAREQLWDIHRDLDFASLQHQPDLVPFLNFNFCLERISQLLQGARSRSSKPRSQDM